MGVLFKSKSEHLFAIKKRCDIMYAKAKVSMEQSGKLLRKPDPYNA